MKEKILQMIASGDPEMKYLGAELAFKTFTLEEIKTIEDYPFPQRVMQGRLVRYIIEDYSMVVNHWGFFVCPSAVLTPQLQVKDWGWEVYERNTNQENERENT